MTMLQVGVIGTGQAYQRLYRPAMALVPGMQVAATADPVGPAAFRTAEELMVFGKLDGVIVLSPAAMHADHVALAASKGIHVLVEKPPALSTRAIEAWPNQELVTPAFSRRYWPNYRERRGPGHRWVFHLQTNPATWGATHVESPERDLLPHAADLATWLSRERIAAVEGVTRHRSGVSGAFVLSEGGQFEWTVAHGAEYAETLTLDGEALAGPSAGVKERVLQRLGRRPGRDVAGVAALLSDWAQANQGRSPEGLPTVADAHSCAAALEAVDAAISDTSE